MLKKRLKVSQARRQELENSTNYLICCRVEECGCTLDAGFCERGFFSLFIQAVEGMMFAQHFRLHPVVNYGTVNSPYSDPDENDPNFWNYFFIQEQPVAGPTVINQMFESYPLRIWQRSILRKIHERVVKTLRFQPDVEAHLRKAILPLKNKRSLGIHWRGTDHHVEIEPVPLSRLIRLIRKKIRHADVLFVATDEQPVLNILKKEFGEKVLYTDADRSVSGKPLHRDPESLPGRQFGLGVLTDCYCLSKCDEVILMQSNVSYSVLLFNPEIPYTLLESSSARWNRRKTTLVYLLDRLGIRR